MRVFVNNRDLLLWPRAIIERILAEGHEPIVVDNGSTYPALLDWYAAKPCEVVLLGRNFGFQAPWGSNAIARCAAGELYAETDPDLDLSPAPRGFLDRLVLGIERYPEVTKCGLSLALDDLPDTPMGRQARGDQRWCWCTRRDAEFYEAHTDTTFAVYRHGVEWRDWYTSVRTAPPFSARHLPWYLDAASLPEDYAWYLRNLAPGPWRYSTAIREAAEACGGLAR